MKKMILASLIGLLVAPISAFAEEADAVYINGKIYTVNDEQPWAEAVAIEDGTFVFVGDDEEAKTFIGPNTEIIDLEQRMAMPGLHDAHQHLLKAQNRQIYCQISPEAKLDELIASLRSCGETNRFGGWIVADVYRGDNFPGGEADRSFLDDAFPDTPIYIREWSYHHGLANTKALEIAGINGDTPDPEGGRILHRDDGQPTGELLSKATWLVTQHIPGLPESTMRDALIRTEQLSLKYGITSVQDAASSRAQTLVIQELDNAGDWHLRTLLHQVWGNSASAMMSQEDIADYLANFEQFQSARVFTNAVKIYVDGSPLQPHATDVELDDEGHFDRNRLYENPEVIAAALTHFDMLGFKVKMHAVGSGAIRVALDGIEAMRKVNGSASDMRPDIAHSLRYGPGDIERASELGAVAEMSPAIWQIEGPLTANLAGAWPFKSLLEAGVMMTLGSDWVVLPEPNLFPAMGGMLDHGNESIALEDVLRIATLNGAISTGWEDITGSIETGKLANMIVLDRNLFDVAPSEIGGTVVLKTVFEGEVVYSAERSCR